MIRYKINFKGRVQRVGFRYFVSKCAYLYGLTGYVKNLADGSVEAQIQGSKDRISQFMEKVKEGNGRCEVSSYTQNDVFLCENEQSFVIC